MKSLRYIAAGLAVLFVGVVFAATITATWTNPTQNTDGTTLASSEIKQTRIEYGTCNGTAFGAKSGEVIVEGVGTTTSVQGLTPGTWCARAYTTSIYGVESDASNVASKVVAAPKPNAPSNFSWN